MTNSIIVETQMTHGEFVSECIDKWGWDDGALYPTNIMLLWKEMATEYNLELWGVEDTSHNKYRYSEYYPTDISETRFVTLRWQLLGRKV